MTEQTRGTRSTSSRTARPKRTAAADDSKPRRTTAADDSKPRRATTTTASPARRDAHDTGDGSSPSPRGRAIDARRAAALAAANVRELTGKDPEVVVALERTEDGWRVAIEVLESRRVPDSTDLLAVYRVELDQEGELVGYRREQRYHRGRGEERT
jgi:hypothetical protein